mmetsp:Transcript_10489/g.23086  ORF Transcript_10489/g.23086 Transcript_10489/m.23086 type:complete len:411 (+) Transcript_10489:124-1356(+)|eukprot:CAMPEP_0206454352 /NCGR_PEP_ID=MMETSP0324_2-20121206/21087_1 /ASSEMBLY_ACC=CAM_ASM_000836 /TAXON_ID=2866 /ORGANISM="Crypthecodinium cohnii, Strain Seligo" /LENGTH=410 /DNA_ID=CAMNT_0053924811 /DNA_START=100 /DNA_END=1332 /DNA_ORIENTATION=+
MFRTLAVVTLVAGQATATGDVSHEEYMTRFGKSYSAAELEARKATYLRRLATIQAQNENPDRLWTAGLNEYTDWHDHELSTLRGARRVSGDDSSDFAIAGLSLMASAGQALDEPASGDETILPERLDWRERYPSVISPVKSQSSCGSCWAFTAAQELESFAALATGVLMELSPQAINSCSPNPNKCGGWGGCMGSIPQLGYNWTMTNGVPDEWTAPYTSGITYETGECTREMRLKPQVRNLGFVNLPRNNKAALMKALVEEGPIGIILASGDWWQYEKGIFDACNVTDTYGLIIDHAVQLVGYGQELDTKYWLIRNSWGAMWGEQGYIRLKRHDQEPCGWDNRPSAGSGCEGGPDKVWVCGECGMLYEPSYPTGVHYTGKAHRRLSEDEVQIQVSENIVPDVHQDDPIHV